MRLEQARLLGDRCLVLLAPVASTSKSGVVLEPAITPVVCYGRVLRAGPECVDVSQGDLVAFPPSVGDPLDHKDFQLLFVREREIAFVLSVRGES